MRGLSSTLTLASSTAPSVAATARSSMGPSVVHGPHQGAQRSTMTGTSCAAGQHICLKCLVGNVHSHSEASERPAPR